MNEPQGTEIVKMGLTPAPVSGELTAAASAALAKATIEAKFTVALHRPRSVLTARGRILEACKRSGFAESAKWLIERWDARKQKYVPTEGFSIRFAEAALQAWTNVDVSASIAFEDESKRVVRIVVTDLENNISFTDEAVLGKTVERAKKNEKQEVVGERLNSEGKPVYIVKATEDELLQKVNSAKSKAIRTSGLRLIPQDILDEAWDACEATIKAKDQADPAAATKRICDNFQKLGVFPNDLEAYLGHPLQATSPRELDSLRQIWSAINQGEAQWRDYAAKKPEPEAKDPAPKAAAASSAKAVVGGGEGKEADAIPMTFPKASGPSAPPTAGPAATTVSPTPAPAPASGQAAVPAGEPDSAALMVAAANEKGVKFDAFVRWAKQAGEIPEDSDPADASEFPPAFVKRWGGRINALKRMLQVAIDNGGLK